MGFKFFKLLAKLGLHFSFWFLTISAKCAGLKAMYRLESLGDDVGFDVHYRWVENEQQKTD